MSNNITIMNTVWENASTDYQNRIPVATQSNVTSVGNAILSYTATTNEFLNALVNRISMVLVSSKMAKNPLAPFKRGMIEYGSDIEEIFTSMANAQHFDVSASETTVRQRNKPDVKSIFHRVNREDFYKVTIEQAQIKRAFLSNDGLGKLVASIVNSLYSGDTYDEYVLAKETVARYFSGTNVPQSAIVDTSKVVDQNTAKAFFRTVKQVSTDMTFMSTNFNAKGVMQRSEKDEQVLLLHKNVNTYLDTDVLAWVFNQSNINFDMSRVIIVDNFGSLANTQAVLCDKNWLMLYDKLFETTNEFNPQGLYWNYWLHHHELLSYSLFHNAVRFTTTTPA
jgi:hypothetical protein